MNEDPILYGYIVQDEDISYYYLINYSKIQDDLAIKKPNYVLMLDSYTFVEINYITDTLKYPLTHTPFNYDYVGSEHTTYHIKLTIQGEAPVYSYENAFNDYVLKIENNYIYFKDKKYDENGYIDNKTQVTVDYKFKLQPGLLDQEHFTMIIYPYKSYFDTELSSITGPINYRDGYRKISGSSIITPFEYSLSINDTYSLYLSYRLNEREHYEEKFEIDYASGELDFYYMQGGIENYVSEFIDSEGVAAIQVYYYDLTGRKQILSPSHYNVTTNEHKITLLGYGNAIVDQNNITEFYISFIPALNDYQHFLYQFSFNQSFDFYTNASAILNDTFTLTNWKVVNGELYDLLPNLNSYYFINESESTFHYQALAPQNSSIDYVGYVSQISAFLEEDEKLVFNLTGEVDPIIINDIRAGNYVSLYMNTIFGNYESLDSLKIELFDTQDSTLSAFTTIIPLEELLYWNFNIKINLPTTTNDLEYVQFTPIFSTERQYSESNSVGVPRFEFLQWNNTLVNYTSNGYDYMIYRLNEPIFTEDSPNDIAYLFNERLEYLKLPTGVPFDWTVDTDDFGYK
ncbi:MAG: hypothetical protein ACW99Q_28795, partial [Candidatus Kariarchaeaceae archaeon]